MIDNLLSQSMGSRFAILANSNVNLIIFRITINYKLIKLFANRWRALVN